MRRSIAISRRLDGYLFEPPNESLKNLEKEFDACLRAGIAVEWVKNAPIEAFDTHRAIRFPRQAQMHPLKYLRGLAEAVKRRGGQIYTGTKVEEAFGGENARVTTTNKLTVTAKVGGRGDQFADQRSLRHSHEAGALHDLCDRAPGAAR